MDVSNIRRPEDWPFPIPKYLAEDIDALIDALARDASASDMGLLLDNLDGSTRDIEREDWEMQVRDYYLRKRWRNDRQQPSAADPQTTQPLTAETDKNLTAPITR